MKTVKVGDSEMTEEGAVAVVIGRVKGEVHNTAREVVGKHMRRLFQVSEGAWLREGEWHGPFGRFAFYSDKDREVAGMNFYCPGCAGARSQSFVGNADWPWDGNEEEPTLSLNIGCKCGWFGMLKKGLWIKLS